MLNRGCADAVRAVDDDMTRVTFDVTMVTGAATEAIKVVIREGLTVAFLFVYLLWANWRLTLVMVAVLPR